jgi:hypothetical protein
MSVIVREIQAWLNELGAQPRLAVDGVAGRRTMAAIDERLGPIAVDWSDARKLVGIEQWVYKQFNIEVGEIDGLVGEQTRWARTIFTARGKDKTKPNLKEETWRDHVETGKPIPPQTEVRQQWPRQSQVQSFYGAPGTGFVMLELPFPFRIAWEPSKTIQRASVHGKCRTAFDLVWRNTLAHYGYDEIRRLRLDMFGGCANVRRMRGGSGWSMHAFACAWDVDPDRNQLRFNRAQATLDETPYTKFWQFVYAQGGLSLGIERNYDWMHFQFTRDFS